MFNSDTLPFSSTHKGHTQMEYHFVFFHGVARDSGMGQVITFQRGKVVEYSTNQYATVEIEDLERQPNIEPYA